MYRHAIIKDGVVSSIILADDAFTSSLSDTTINIHDNDEIQIGHLYDESTAAFSVPEETTTEPTEEDIIKEAKIWRHGELSFTDQLVPLTDLPNYDSWIAYRQTLRDWPSTDSFPNTKPRPSHLLSSEDNFQAWVAKGGVDSGEF